MTVDRSRLLIWSVDETTGYDAAWAETRGTKLVAEGRAAGLEPQPYSLDYRLETDDGYATALMVVASRWTGGSATLELRRSGGDWTVDGVARPDLHEALDCDLEACPLTNTMPILRHGLHERRGDVMLRMAFIEVPALRVVVSEQRYTHLGLNDRGALVRFRSGTYQRDLTIDREGFVIDYPGLAQRLAQPDRSAHADP